MNIDVKNPQQNISKKNIWKASNTSIKSNLFQDAREIQYHKSINVTCYITKQRREIT